MAEKNKRAKKTKIYVVTGMDLEVQEVKDSKELNSTFVQLGIQKPVDSAYNKSPGFDMYTDEGEQCMAFVIKGGEPMQLNTSIEFHLDE